MLFFLIVLTMLALELIPKQAKLWADLIAAFRWIRARVPDWCALASLGALVLSFAVEIASVQHANAGLIPRIPWVGQLPITVMVLYPQDLVPASFRMGFVLLSTFQALSLGLYLVAMHGRPWRSTDTLISAGAASIIVVMAVLAPAITSYDMYAYVADSLLGARAYDPPLTPLAGPYAIIHHMWFLPLLPAAYGPAWLWWNHFVLGLAGSLSTKLMVLRGENVVAFLVTLVAMRRLGVAPRFVAATAVNPALAWYFLSNGHNDIVPVAIVLVAMTFAARMPVVAGIVAGVAASMKLTLIVPAATVVLVIAALPRRIAYVAVMVFVAATIAIVFGGQPYFHALTAVSNKYALANEHARVRIPHIVTALITLALVGAAVWKRRTYAGAVFGFVALAQAFFPWYAIWSLPYAVSRERVLTALLVGLPVMTALLDVEVSFAHFVVLALFATMLVILSQSVWRASLRRRRPLGA